jgi:CxxC-x17-CxxC domain-containing protein
MITFRVGAADAEFLVREFTPQFTEEDLVNLDKYNVYLKLLIDGVSSKPFSALTIPPITEEIYSTKTVEKAIKVSRERNSRPKQEVEDRIIRWLNLDGVMEDDGRESSLSQSSGKKKEPLIAHCDNCGKDTELPFKPKPGLNIFCKDCLKKFKEGEIDASKIKSKNQDLINKIEAEKANKDGVQPQSSQTENYNSKEKSATVEKTAPVSVSQNTETQSEPKQKTEFNKPNSLQKPIFKNQEKKSDFTKDKIQKPEPQLKSNNFQSKTDYNKINKKTESKPESKQNIDFEPETNKEPTKKKIDNSPQFQPRQPKPTKKESKIFTPPTKDHFPKPEELEEVKPEVPQEEVSLNDLSNLNRTDFKSSHGRTVKPGEVVKLND